MTLNKYDYIGLGMGVGAAIGAAIGSGLHQMGAWLPIGSGVGLAIAISIAERNCSDKPSQSAKSVSDDRNRKLATKS